MLFHPAQSYAPDGFDADLVVLSPDIFTVPPPELPKTVSVLTLVGGKIIHDSDVLKRE